MYQHFCLTLLMCVCTHAHTYTHSHKHAFMYQCGCMYVSLCVSLRPAKTSVRSSGTVTRSHHPHRIRPTRAATSARAGSAYKTSPSRSGPPSALWSQPAAQPRLRRVEQPLSGRARPALPAVALERELRPSSRNSSSTPFFSGCLLTMVETRKCVLLSFCCLSKIQVSPTALSSYPRVCQRCGRVRCRWQWWCSPYAQGMPVRQPPTLTSGSARCRMQHRARWART